MPICYFYSPSRYQQTKSGTGESRYLHDEHGNVQAYTHCVPLLRAEWEKQLIVGQPLSSALVQALRIYNIPADAKPVMISDTNHHWGILVTNRAAYDAQPEHAHMGEGILPTRKDSDVIFTLRALAA